MQSQSDIIRSDKITLTHMDELVPLIRERLAAGQSVSFSPKGTSMLPMLRQGRDGVVLSTPPSALKKYDIPLYQRDDGHYILHRVVKAGDTYTCIGDHQFEEEPGVRPDQIIAVVKTFTRDGREISVENVPYQVYCRLWHWSRFPRRCLRSVKRRVNKWLT